MQHDNLQTVYMRNVLALTDALIVEFGSGATLAEVQHALLSRTNP